MYNLGNCYFFGEGTIQDYKLAFYWYEKSANLGNHYGMNSLGNCYHFGKGIGTSSERDYNGMNNLGMRYEYGQGIEQNYEKALNWYKKSADLGNTDAMYNLIKYYENRGDEENVIKYVSIIIERNDVRAIYDLGLYFQKKNDYKKMIKYYEIALTMLKNSFADAFEYPSKINNDEIIKSINEYLRKSKDCGPDDDEFDKLLLCIKYLDAINFEKI